MTVATNPKSSLLPPLLSPLEGDDLISSVFEVDGDISDPAVGKPDDWGTLNCDGGNADVKTFLHDGSGVSIFTQGGSKDPSDISVPDSHGVLKPGWKHTNGAVPDKDDILNAYAAKYTGSPNGDTIIAFGADRLDASGDAFFGAWFFQKTVYAAADGTFREQVGSDPAASDPLATHTLGDILVLINFTGGGGLATGAVYEWIPAGTPCPAGTPVGQAASKTLCDITGTAPVGSVLGVSNDNTGALVISPSCLAQPGQTLPWDELFTPKTGTPGTIPAAQFFEGAINFDAFPRLRDSCFNTLVIETRSASSPSAQLKDFVIGQFDTCPEIELTKEADDTVVCALTPTEYTYTVNNPTALNLTITLVDDNETPLDTTDDLDVLAACAPIGIGADPSSQIVGPGETEFTCTRTLLVGEHTNIATVIASIGGTSTDPVTATETVTVVAAPIADAGTDQTVCRSSGFGMVDFVISDGSASNGTPSWSFPGTNTAGCSVILGGDTATPTIRCTSFGTATAQLTVTSDTPGAECPNATDDVVLTINPNATAAAGDDQSVCVDDTFTSTSFEVTGTVTAATPVWSITGANSANCSVDPAEVNSLTATVTCTSLGTATVQLLADSNNGCTDATDSLVLTVNANPEANAGPDQTLCAAGDTTPFTLAGTADHGTHLWTVVSGPAEIDDPSSLTSGVTFTGTGTATLQLTTTSNSTPSCETAEDTVVLTVNPNPLANAGPDQTLCDTGGSTSFTLAGSASNGTAVWSVVSGPAVIADTSSLTSGVTFTGIGTATLKLTTTSNFTPSCGSVEDLVVLTVNPNPEANAGPDQTTCAAGATTPFTLAGSAANGTAVWSVVSGPAVIDDPSNLASGVTFTGIGTAILRLTTTSNFTPSCGTAEDTVVLTVDPNPTVTICGDEACSVDDILALTANVSPSTGTITYLWSGPAGGISSDATAQTISVVLPGYYTVMVTRTASGASDACPGMTTMHVGLCPGGVCAPPAP
jgi:hypothetical protein